MTVETEQSEIQYTGIVDGALLAVPFPVQTDTDIVIYYDDNSVAVMGVDYTVTLAPPDYEGATVTVLPGFTAKCLGAATIRREIPYLQDVEIPTLAKIASSRLEQICDRLTFMCQQLRDRFSSTLQFPVNDPMSAKTPLPTAANRALKFFAFDAFGAPTVAVGVTSAGTPGSLFGVAWYALANAASALTALGITWAASFVTAVSASAARLVLGVYEYDIRAFGASTTNTAAQNSTAVQAQINAMIAATGDVVLRVGDGIFPMGARLDFTGAKTVAITGNGCGVSALRWDVANGGLKIPFDTPDSTNMNKQTLTLRDISLMTTIAGGGTAVDLSYTTAVGDTSIGAIIDGCYIGYPNNNVAQYWTYGVKLTNAREPYITKTDIYGAAFSMLSMTAAIYATGGTVGLRVDNCDIGSADTGILIDHENEGALITATTIVGVNVGVSWKATAPYTGTNMTFIGGHISAFKAGIVLQRMGDVIIADNLFIKRDESTDAYADISCLNSVSFVNIHDNIFKQPGTSGANNGIELDIASAGGTGAFHIHHNYFLNRDKGIYIGNGGPTDVDAHDNWMDPATVTVGIYNQDPPGKGVRLHDNISADTNNGGMVGATPSADGAPDNYFITANAGATAVTNILHGYHHQRITIAAGDGNTTIKHNANILLSGGVDFVMASGYTLSLIFNKAGPLWQETSRKV